MGASMIPATPRVPASIPGRPCWVGWSLALAACVAPGEPSLARLARERRDGGAYAERDRRRRELEITRQETRDLLAAITAAKAESVGAAAALRAARAELARQLEQLQAVERDLEAARAQLPPIDGADDPAPR